MEHNELLSFYPNDGTQTSKKLINQWMIKIFFNISNFQQKSKCEW